MSGRVAIYNPKDETVMIGESFSLEPHPRGRNMFLTLSEEDDDAFSDTAIHHFVFHHRPENAEPPKKAFRVISTGTVRGICNDDGSTSYDIVVEELSQADVPDAIEAEVGD